MTHFLAFVLGSFTTVAILCLIQWRVEQRRKVRASLWRQDAADESDFHYEDWSE